MSVEDTGPGESVQLHNCKICDGWRSFERLSERESPVFRPFGACSYIPSYPWLTPLRQAQGRLWAAFFRRFAAAHIWVRVQIAVLSGLCLTSLPTSLISLAGSEERGASWSVASIRPSSTASKAREERSRTSRRYFWAIGRSAG